MKGRAYIRSYVGEVLIQVWLKSIKIFDIECAKREFEETLWGFTQPPANHKSQQKKQKMMRCFLMEGILAIRCVQKSCVMDFNELQVSNSLYNKGTIC